MNGDEIRKAQATLRAGLAPAPERPRVGFAFGLYAFWCALAWISHAAGQTVLPADIGLLLIGGISATNALFFGISRANASYQPSESALTTAQVIFGVVWSAIYAFFSSGPGELVVGMYITIILFAIFQVSRATFVSLTTFAVLTYCIVVASKHYLSPQHVDIMRDGFRITVFLGVMLWLLTFGRAIHILREQLHARNDELQSMIEKISRVAERDHLTKSFNRHYIMESLAREKGRADRANHPFSICILDLDHFKAMNDDHGHLVGDRVLRAFAKRVRTELRTMDAVNRNEHRRSLGRYGGEEFIAILPATALSGAQQCAERIRKAIAERAFDDVYNVTVSAGVAQYQRGETVAELLERADQALYKAKNAGRNRVCISGQPRRPGGPKAPVTSLHGAK